jgi:hypothetical protein
MLPALVVAFTALVSVVAQRWHHEVPGAQHQAGARCSEFFTEAEALEHPDPDVRAR